MYNAPNKATRKVFHALAVEQAYTSLMQQVEMFSRNIDYHNERLDKLARAADESGETFDIAEEYDYGELLRATANREIYAALAEQIAKL